MGKILIATLFLTLGIIYLKIDDTSVKTTLSINNIASKIDNTSTKTDLINIRSETEMLSRNKLEKSITANVLRLTFILPAYMSDSILYMCYTKALKYNIPVEILTRMCLLESKGNPAIYDSPAGAKGIMQMLPATFNECRIKLRLENANIYDTDTNMECAAFYLSQLYNNFKAKNKKLSSIEAWKKAVIYYNGGWKATKNGKIVLVETQNYHDTVFGGLKL